MGITGLLPLLKSIQHQRHLREFAGKTLGVDTYGWLHKAIIPCAIELAQGEPTTKYVGYILHRVRMLKYFGVTPYLVFDGDYLPSKAATEIEREQRRASTKSTGLELLRLGKTTDAHKELQKAVDINPTMAKVVIDACRKLGVKCIVAPYEADAQLYYLEKIGEIDGVISEDSDMLVYGVKRLITKLDQYGECVEINREHFTACRDVSLAGWSDREFRMMCILSGCDYLDNINGIGLKKAHGLVKRHGDVSKIVRSVKFDGTKKVPDGYEEAFLRAEVTFRHQRVFCPRENKLVFCNEPEAPLDDEHLIHIGPDLDEDIAQGVAQGYLDPMTKTPLVPHHTASNPRSDFKLSARQTPLTGVNKRITSFFKPKSVPKPIISSGPNSAPRTPLQPRDANIGAHRPAFSAPCIALSTCAAKRPFASVGQSNKRARIEDYDDDPENGEQSEFFKNKARRIRVKPSTHVISTPSRAVQKQEARSTAVESTPETPTPKAFDTSKISILSDVDSAEKVAKGWKSKYGHVGGSSTQRNAQLSKIFKNQRTSSQEKTTPLQCLSASSAARGNTTQPSKTPSKSSTIPQKTMKSFDVESFLTSGSRGEGMPQLVATSTHPSARSFENDIESGQEDWPEFVGVDKFNRFGSSSKSLDQPSAVRGIFNKFVFQG